MTTRGECAALCEPLESRTLLSVDTVTTIEWDSTGPARPTFGFVQAGPALLFVSRRGDLWRTDGTAAGTNRVADLDAMYHLDSRRQATQLYPRWLTLVGRTVFFAGGSREHGMELWASDGTARGTRMVADVNRAGAGFNHGYDEYDEPLGNHSSSPSHLVALGDRVYFFASDHRGRSLWTSDGTAAGTTIVKDLSVRWDDGDVNNVVAAGGRLYFLTTRPDGLQHLWVSDGTTRGTAALKEIPGGGGDLVAAHGHVYVTSRVEGSGFGRPAFVMLWRTDGTRDGTVRVARVASPGVGTRPRLSAAGRFLYFPVEHTNALYQYDPTGDAGGARPVRAADGAVVTGVARMQPLGSRMLFAADPFPAIGGEIGREPWVTDGSPNGARPLGDLAPGIAPSDDYGYGRLNGKYYFFSGDGPSITTDYLYEFDGRKAVTRVLDINGYRDPTPTVIGGVFHDRDADGRIDAGEPGIAGVPVFLDYNNNGRWDVGPAVQDEPLARTGPDGSYRLTAMSPGWIRVVQGGLARWASTTGRSASLESGAGPLRVPWFGNTIASVSGTLFHDTNRDGVRGIGELPLGGWRVFLDDNYNGAWDAGEPAAATSGQGRYRINGVTPGARSTLRVEPPTGPWRSTTPPNFQYRFTARAGESLVRHFGAATVTSAVRTFTSPAAEDRDEDEWRRRLLPR